MVLLKNDNNVKKSNLFIVGAAKAGTTSLYYYLKRHPEVFMSSVKEPNFFSKDLEFDAFVNGYSRPLKLDFIHLAYVRNFDDYMELFRDVEKEPMIGESDTSYLYSKKEAEEIYKFNPNAKIIILLRDPIERAFSHYLMNLKIGISKNPDFISEFYEDLKKTRKGWGISHFYLELGLYYEQVKRYTDIFPKKNLKIVLFEDFKNNSEFCFFDILQFLGFSTDFVPDKKYNQREVPKNPALNKRLRIVGDKIKKTFPCPLKKLLKKGYYRIFFKSEKPKLDPEFRKNLIRFFKSNIEDLENLLGLDLDCWRSSNE